MGKSLNQAGSFMPHHESRRLDSVVLGVANATATLSLDGDNSASIYLDSLGNAVNATYVIEGSVDGSNWFPLLGYSYPPAAVGGTVPLAGQPLVSEGVTVATKRLINVATGGLRGIRVRLSAYTSGSFTATVIADTCDSINPYVRDQKSATLTVTATAAAGTAVTATLPAVAGLRHYIDVISVVRSATVALTASATPTLVTTTNLPGTPVLTFGSDAAQVGQDKTQELDFGSAGLAATAVGTNTTIVASALTGVIWRINVSYRLGL